MALTSGTRLGPYEISSALGAGGMGEVYRARDTRLGRDVAVKILPAEMAGDAQRLQRFEQEARVISSLNHPNVLAIFDVGAQDGAHFLVTELVEGDTLRERMRAGRISVRKGVELAVQIAAGLGAAHERGIVHRDLKPENLIVTPDGRVKILDFGLAKVSAVGAAASGDDLTHSVAVTREGVVLGTVGYMSPEQVRGNPADHRSDIFSFGVILYEMLSGQRAFTGDSSIEVMNAILKEDPPELATLRPSAPPALQRVVGRCLEKAPEERFQSARDLAFALETLSSSPSSTTQRTLAGERGRRGRFTIAAAAVLVVLAVVGALLLGVRMGAAGGKAVAFHQLNYRHEAVFRALMAPDGKTVVYSAAEQGDVPEIYTLSPDYPEARSLGLRNVQLLSVSSKGELALLTHARYIAHRLFLGTLATMPLGGGAPREILEGVREADWAPNGSGLAIVRNVAGHDRLEYPIGTTLAETGGYFSDLRFSPRGDRIAVFEHPQQYDDRGAVVILDADGKNRKTLADGYWGVEGLAWSPAGDEVYYSAGTGYSNFRIYATDLSGHSRVALESAGGLVIQDVVGSGHWVAIREDERRGFHALVPGSAQEREFGWLDISNHPKLSRDNSLLLFDESGAAAGVNYKVCLRRTDGSPVVLLGDGSAEDLSPDNRWALAVVPSDPQTLMLYPTGAGEARKLERGNIDAYNSGRFFPDGKRILVCGNEQNKPARCYIQDLAGGPPKPFTPEGTQGGLVAPDGRKALVVDLDGKWSLYAVDGGSPVAVPGLQPTDRLVRFTPDGRQVTVLIAGVPGLLERVDITTGRRSPLVTLAPADRTGVLRVDAADISDDGRYLVYSAREIQSSIFDITGAH